MTKLPPYLSEFASAAPLAVLRALLVGEADGESYEGKLAIAWVVRNRAAHPGGWGVDLKSVCLSKHQFTCFWTHWSLRSAALLKALRDPAAYPAAHKAAQAAINGYPPDPTGGATHYFNPRVVRPLPTWAAKMTKVASIGHHDFYRE